MSDATLHQHLHQPAHRHPLRPHFVHGAEDPTLTRRPRALTPGSITLTAFAVAFWLYASGHIPALDRYFDRIYWLSLQHNDEIVAAILGWVPALLGLGMAGLITVTVLLRVNARRRRQAFARARQLTEELRAELAPVHEELPLPKTRIIAINDPQVRMLRPVPRARKFALPTAG